MNADKRGSESKEEAHGEARSQLSDPGSPSSFVFLSAFIRGSFSGRVNPCMKSVDEVRGPCGIGAVERRTSKTALDRRGGGKGIYGPS
jgi:hypothetical protein